MARACCARRGITGIAVVVEVAVVVAVVVAVAVVVVVAVLLRSANQIGFSFDDPPDKPVSNRFLSAHPVIPFGVTGNLLERLPRGTGENAVQSLTHEKDLARFDLDIRRGAPHPAKRLVQERSLSMSALVRIGL